MATSSEDIDTTVACLRALGAGIEMRKVKRGAREETLEQELGRVLSQESDQGVEESEKETEEWEQQQDRVLPQGLSQGVEESAKGIEELQRGIDEGEQLLVIRPITEPVQGATLDCAESGSTLRFMLPVAAACAERVHFIGSGRLPERPLGELVSAMRMNGVAFSSDHLPLSTQGTLHSGSYTVPGHISSQFITGLLLALPLLEGTSEIVLTSPLESMDYVNITLEVLRHYGIEVEQEQQRFIVPGCQRYRSPGKVRIEGDWSNAAFFLAAGALSSSSPVTVCGLSLHSAQGDRRVVDLLRQFGAEVVQDSGQVSVLRAPLRGTEIDIGETPDLLPVLAVVAACATGETHFTNAARLRLKESDRLQATAELIRSLGGQATELPEGLIIGGGGLKGGCVDSYHDHRIAMAAAVAAIACFEPVTILDAGAVAKSYPAFYSDYQKLGGMIDVI